PLLPYTTLFRSRHRGRRGPEGAALHARRPEHGLAYDLTWTGIVPAFQEPTHLDHDANGRAFLHACRLAQLGSWSGWLEVDGNRYEVTPDRWWGSRDRSWGIRPVGDPEPPGNLAGKPAPGFRWLYAPFRMPDHAMILICQERDDGRRLLEEAVRLWPDGRGDHLGRPEHHLTWDAAGPGLVGTVERAALRLGAVGGDGEGALPVQLGVRGGAGGGREGDVAGEGAGRGVCGAGARAALRLGAVEVGVEAVLAVPLGVGTGYGFDSDGWRHGKHQGELVVEGRVWDLADETDRSAM